MKHWALVLLLFISTACVAQRTNVTATVRDPAGLIYANATVNIDLVGYTNGASGPPQINGAVVNQLNVVTFTDSNGTFSVPLYDNSFITPANTQWRFTICATGGSPCFSSIITITGASQNISDTLLADAAFLPVDGAIAGSTIVKLLNNVRFADQFSGSDACAKIAAAIADLPSSGGVVDARGLVVGQSCGANPFDSVTKPVVLELSPSATYTSTKTWAVNTSNVHIRCNGAAIIFSPSAPYTSANDRAVIFDWAEPSVPSSRPITGAIAAGDTTFTASNASDTNDLVAGDWLHVIETDPNANGGDAVAFDIVQVASKSGATVTLQRPFDRPFANNHSPGTLVFQRMAAAPVENDSIEGCRITTTPTDSILPAIDVHRTRNTLVENNVISAALGQPLYSYRSQGAKFIHNKIKITATTETVGSEFAESVDTEVSGNDFQVEGSAAGTAAILLDFGLTGVRFVNNIVASPKNIAVQITDGVYQATITGNRIGYVYGSNTNGILARGARNMVVSGNTLTGGAATSVGIDFNDTTELLQNIISSGNIIGPNSVAGFTSAYSVPKSGDVLIGQQNGETLIGNFAGYLGSRLHVVGDSSVHDTLALEDIRSGHEHIVKLGPNTGADGFFGIYDYTNSRQMMNCSWSSGDCNFPNGLSSFKLFSAVDPTCDASHAGWMNYHAGGGGVDDTEKVCTKDSAGTYAWRQLVPVSSGITTPTGVGLCPVSTGTNPGDYTWQSCTGSASTNWSALVANAANASAGTFQIGNGTVLNTTGTGTIDANQYKGTNTPTGTEFGYLSGVTSAIQTQLNAKIASGGNIGAATATTPTAGDSSTKVATTAYVQGELSNGAYAALTDGATITWNFANSANSRKTLTIAGNRTLNLTNIPNGATGTLIVKQDATGSRTLTLGTGCTWKVGNGGLGVITLSTSANAVDIISFTYDGTNCYAVYTPNFN